MVDKWKKPSPAISEFSRIDELENEMKYFKDFAQFGGGYMYIYYQIM